MVVMRESLDTDGRDLPYLRCSQSALVFQLGVRQLDDKRQLERIEL